MNTNTPDTTATIRQFEAMTRAYHDANDRIETAAAQGLEGDELEALGDEFIARRDAFMQTPAPDLAGLHAKLKTVFAADENGFTVEWSHRYLAQTLADIDRLLRPTAALPEKEEA